MKTDKFFASVKPEEVGISSSDVVNFVNTCEDRGIFLHSYLILKDGKIAAEGYYPPFDESFLHRMYSVSKSFVATAIGVLADENKISLDDKVYKYFEDKILPEGMHPYTENVTIRELLTMTTPFDDCAYAPCCENMDWVQTFFDCRPTHPSGTVFHYDTCGTYMLDVIVERVTGMPFMKYLYEKVLKEMDFSKDTWCVQSPDGYSWGGSGVMASTRDLAKLATLYLNKGKINGKQLLSEQFINEATSPLVNNRLEGAARPYHYGYGYQIWCGKDGMFAFIGMGGQLAFMFPDKNLAFFVTGDNQGNADAFPTIFYAFEDCVLKKMSAVPLAPNDDAYKGLCDKNASLKFPLPYGKDFSPLISKINGKTVKCNLNPMGISEFSLSFEGNDGIFSYKTGRGDKKIHFGLGKHVESTFPEPQYFDTKINFPGNRELRCTSAAAWFSEREITIRTYIIDNCFGNLSISISFNGEEVGMYMCKTAEFFLEEYQGFAGGKIVL